MKKVMVEANEPENLKECDSMRFNRCFGCKYNLNKGICAKNRVFYETTLKNELIELVIVDGDYYGYRTI